MNNSQEIQKLYSRFFTLHQDSINALLKILGPLPIEQQQALSLVDAIVKLWDDFDADAKDLIVGALKRLDQKNRLSDIPQDKLLKHIFYVPNRRRLLRDAEIRALFPQLSSLLPLGYNARWWRLPDFPVNPKGKDWLQQHDLVANPFGVGDFKNYPFYPEGAVHPDRWEDFLTHLPQLAQCPTSEDARMLAFLLRSECLPIKSMDENRNEIVHIGRQVFPVWVSLGHTVPTESPLPALARSAAQGWLDILPFSPDAMLDLLPAEQIALLELLCWSFGSNITVINLFKRAGLQDGAAASVIVHKLQQFENKFSSAHLPPDSVLMSWLKIRPPDTTCAYLIFPLDEFPAAVHSWWLEQFNSLIPTLFLNEIVTKALTSSYTPAELSLSMIQLKWHEAQLKTSLNAQFEAAMNKSEQHAMGKIVNFRSLFGSDANIGYFEREEDTTDKLVSASHNSLARMLTLGNCLLQYHCKNRTRTTDGVPEKYLHVEDLETILKSA